VRGFALREHSTRSAVHGPVRSGSRPNGMRGCSARPERDGLTQTTVTPIPAEVQAWAPGVALTAVDDRDGGARHRLAGRRTTNPTNGANA